MNDISKNQLYYDENSFNYLVEYRGDFKKSIEKINYATGAAITNTIGVISVPKKYYNRLLQDVPEIIFTDFGNMFVLQESVVSEIDNITKVKINPYLSLTGKGVLIGIVDTGIDYLNEEFIREDGTSRILSIWDQNIRDNSDENMYIGKIYTKEKINMAIEEYRKDNDPYKIVPTKDEVGHGTKIAGIIGARGYNESVEGVAKDCDFVIVKLLESQESKKILRENGINNIPVYNNSELLTGIEYLKNYALKENRPMIICLCIGTTEGSHDGNNLISRYITSIATIRGLVIVAGVGNEGSSAGHVSGNINDIEEVKKIELKVSKDMKNFSFNIWAQKPNRITVSIISPNGEDSKFINPSINNINIIKSKKIKYVFTNTDMSVNYYTPEHFTGHQVVSISFKNIKAGIWKIILKTEFKSDGRYDIWLQPNNTLPEGTMFLEPDPEITLTIPSTARKVITVAYSRSDKNILVSESGRGFNSNNLINPDIVSEGINIKTTGLSNSITTLSGSSAATAIAAGACALLLQWGVIDGNDITMYSTKIRSYFIYGARRDALYKYPNKELGYGNLDLLGVFNVLSKSYRNYHVKFSHDNYEEFYINNLFIRIPCGGKEYNE